MQAQLTGGRLYEELSIEQGACRIDLAIVSDRLEAYEIKSDLDNFSRLHKQIHAYNRVFDRITLVTGPRYADVAQTLMPSWWGISVVNRKPDGSLALQELRVARDNHAQEALSVAMSLWKDEAASILAVHTGSPPSRRATRSQLQQKLASILCIDALRAFVAQRLLERKTVTKPMPSGQGGGWSHLDASCSGFHYLT